MCPNDEWKLINLRLYYDSDYDEWYLEAMYEVKEEYMTKIVTIPKISLPIYNVPVITRSCGYGCLSTNTIDLGFGELSMHPDKNKHLFTERITEERAEEVTVEDIEKKFGHKIKIVMDGKKS